MAQLYTNTALLLDETTDINAVENLCKKTIREGEQALLLAMLEMATEDFQKYALANDNRGKALFQDAEEWILSKNTRWFFSFENVCRHLQLDPGYVRRGLMQWKAAKLNGQAKQGPDGSDPPVTSE